MSEKSPAEKFVAVVKKLTRDIAKHAKEGGEHAEKLKLMKAINSAEDRTYRSGLRGDDVASTFSELRRTAIAAEEKAYQVRTSQRNDEIRDLKEKSYALSKSRSGYDQELAISRGGAYRRSQPVEKQDAIVTAIENFIGDLLK